MLGDYMFGGVVVLWPVRYCCGGVWISSGLLFI